MADLSFSEKKTIESFLEMGSGYVLDFTNVSFQEFIWDSVKKDIDNPSYNNASNSKANRLREFLKVESNQIVGKLLRAFYEYKFLELAYKSSELLTQSILSVAYVKILDRLESESIVSEIDSIKPNNDDLDFDELAKEINDLIVKGKPENGLDRLHTFLVKFVKQVCKNHEIQYKNEESLNAIFGKYVKHLKHNGLIESEMTLKILLFSINLIESFNSVRNDKSFAHDNSILNYEESKLIFNNVAHLVRFIKHVECVVKIEINQNESDELPF